MSKDDTQQRGLLHYAVNPYLDDWDRHFAQRLVQGACEKAGGFRMNAHAANYRISQTKPPPSIQINIAKRDKARRKINAFGQRKYVHASRHSEFVKQQVAVWHDEHVANMLLRLKAKLSVKCHVR